VPAGKWISFDFQYTHQDVHDLPRKHGDQEELGEAAHSEIIVADMLSELDVEETCGE
jgi:hypothetical protein